MLFMLDYTLTTDNVAEVMKLVNDWSLLHGTGIVPQYMLEAIQQKCSTKEETANECAAYYVHVHSEASWSHLASHLYRVEEFAAVEKMKPFLPLRGKHQIIGYAGMNHPHQACPVCVLRHGLRKAKFVSWLWVCGYDIIAAAVAVDVHDSTSYIDSTSCV